MSSRLNVLLTTVECADLYDFLKLDPSATPEELCDAAQKEFNRIHNKGSRGGQWDARKELTGLCKTIFGNNTSKEAYDRALEEAADRKDEESRNAKSGRPETGGFDESSAMLNAGWGLVAHGRAAEAVAVAKRLDGRHPQCSRFRTAVGEMLVKGSEPDEAIKFLRWCEMREPGSREYRALLAMAFAKRGLATWDDFGNGPCATRG